jgi:uncharacterized protein (TIGR00369 family)
MANEDIATGGAPTESAAVDNRTKNNRKLKAPQVPPNCDLTLGMVCIDKQRPGITVWRMKADERFSNPVGAMQGGFIAAFCDSAMGASSLTWHRGRQVYSFNAEMKVSLMRPVMLPAELTCVAKVISGGRRAVFAEAEVTDQSGSLIAKASSTFLISERQAGATDTKRSRTPENE